MYITILTSKIKLDDTKEIPILLSVFLFSLYFLGKDKCVAPSSTAHSTILT